MNREQIKRAIEILRLLTLFPRQYTAPIGMGDEYWRKVGNEYGKCEKDVESSNFGWRVIEYDDGHRELAYLRVLKGGLFSGRYPALYRGLLFPSRIELTTFARIRSIGLAG